MIIEDILQEKLVLNAATKKIFVKTVAWGSVAALLGVLVALVHLPGIYLEIQQGENLLHSIILIIEWLLFFSACCCLLLFVAKLKTVRFTLALKRLRLALILLLALIIIAISYQGIWFTFKDYVLDATR